MSVNFKLLRSSTSDKRPTTAQLATGELGLNFADDSPGLFIKDDADGIVKIGPVEVGTTAPNASPGGSSGNSAGEMWYDTSNTSLKLYNGSSWVVANSGGVDGIVTSANATALTIGSDEQCTFSQSITLQGGDITCSANTDIHIPDNSAQALDIAEGANNYVRFATTDGSELITVDEKVNVNNGWQVGGTDVTSTAAELNLVDGITAGTVSASLAVIVDSNKDITGFRNITATGDVTVPDGDLILGSTAVTSTAAELNVLDGLNRGHLIVGNSSNEPVSLAEGSNGQVLTMDANGDAVWAASGGGGGGISTGKAIAMAMIFG